MTTTLRALLASMDERGASDLYLCAGKPPAMRLGGEVAVLSEPPTPAEALHAFLAEVLPQGVVQALAVTGDADVGATVDGRRYRFNLATQQGQPSAVVRAVHSGSLQASLLGLPAAAERFADAERGLVLVTGSTGSGKSTTLAAMVDRINARRAVHIVTIEDPIEYVHHDQKARVTQREIGPDTASFAAALRGVVRQRPDVILVGELRDADSVRTALSAALTGHLVLASMHTIDATQTVQRLVAYFPDHLRAQVAIDLSLSLLGVISQRLLPRDDGAGQVLAAEVLTATPAVARLVREQRTDELFDLMRATSGDDHITFNRAVLRLYRDGVIDYDVGLAAATNPDEFALQARGMSTGAATFRLDADGELDQELDLKKLLSEVEAHGASDLHLAVDRPPILRVRGDLVPLSDRRLSEADLRLLLYSILSGRQRSIYELEREIDFALAIDGGRRFRVNAYFQKGRMAVAMRSIPSVVPDAASLRLPRALLDLGGRSQGLLLVVGPTGSGKSTTLACLLDQINRGRACRIITIEDPIEYSHTSVKATVDQREVHSDTRSFAAALKFILRQDPDVILVGEMRDAETISAAITAAETGHLVLATLHSNDAIQAVDRIVDSFAPHQQAQIRAQLASALLGIVSQRLLPRADGGGRVPAFEILIANAAVRTLIREGKGHQAQTIIQRSRAEGMVTMDQYLQTLVASGHVTLDDAMRYATNPVALKGGSA